MCPTPPSCSGRRFPVRSALPSLAHSKGHVRFCSRSSRSWRRPISVWTRTGDIPSCVRTLRRSEGGLGENVHGGSPVGTTGTIELSGRRIGKRNPRCHTASHCRNAGLSQRGGPQQICGRFGNLAEWAVGRDRRGERYHARGFTELVARERGARIRETIREAQKVVELGDAIRAWRPARGLRTLGSVLDAWVASAAARVDREEVLPF